MRARIINVVTHRPDMLIPIEYSGPPASAVEEIVTTPPPPPATWDEFHLRTLTWSGGDDTEWLEDFSQRVSGGCNCRREWLEDIHANPPDYSNYFAWGVERHNAVNSRIKKPVVALEDARGYWQNRLASVVKPA